MSKEYKYPMWFKHIMDGMVVRFDGLCSGEVIKKGISNRSDEVGEYSEDWIVHTSGCWEDVSNLYNPLKFGSVPFSISERPKVKHYQDGGIEPIDYINSHNFNFNIGNCIKYCSRAGLKGDAIEDLQKAIHYLQFEIERLENV